MSLRKRKAGFAVDRGKRILLAVTKWGTLFLAFLVLPMGTPIFGLAQEKEIVLVHSNNLNGYLFPCPS